ncbi:DUF4097 family beta strand repeat-containing protein [Yinghuangia aomiensis]
MGAGGVVKVRTDAACKTAELTIRTTDETGAAAYAVSDADLRWDARGAIVAHVRGQGGTTIVHGGGVFVAGNVYGSVVQSAHIVNGTMIGFSVGDLNVSGRGVVASAIEIVAVVPEGTSVAVHTQSADAIADGAFASVVGRTQSGAVRVLGRAEQATAQTQSERSRWRTCRTSKLKSQSGEIRLGRTDVVEARTQSGRVTIRDFGGDAKLQSMSGSIHVHATTGGDITAKTMSGSITVTATDHAVDEGLDVQAKSMSGVVRTPDRRHDTRSPRRRRD